MPNSARNLRKQVIADSKMQVAVILPMATAAVTMTAIYGVCVWLASDGAVGPSGPPLRTTAFLVTGGYFALVLAVTVAVGIKATHRVAGPAVVIERAVRGMRQGNYDLRLELRSNDHMWSLAAELAALRADLQSSREERQQRDASIATALQEGRVQDALALLRSSAATPPVAVDDVHRDRIEEPNACT